MDASAETEQTIFEVSTADVAKSTLGVVHHTHGHYIWHARE